MSAVGPDPSTFNGGQVGGGAPLCHSGRTRARPTELVAHAEPTIQLGGITHGTDGRRAATLCAATPERVLFRSGFSLYACDVGARRTLFAVDTAEMST